MTVLLTFLNVYLGLLGRSGEDGAGVALEAVAAQAVDLHGAFQQCAQGMHARPLGSAESGHTRGQALVHQEQGVLPQA